MEWQTTAMRITYQDPGIVVVHPMADFSGPETLIHAQENLAVIEKFDFELKGALFHLPPYYVNTEATRYYGKNAPHLPVSMVADSFVKKMLGNFLLKLITMKRPMKMFGTEEEAMAWLVNKIKEAEISKTA